MVNEQEQDSGLRPANQGVRDVIPEPNKIGASTPFDFNGKNLTPYGGLLPVITMLDKLDFQTLLEQTLTSQRIPRAMDLYRFVLGIVLGLYIGFPRLNQLRFIAREPILTGILKVTKLPVQSTFWRFVNALHRNVARQILSVMRTMRERVWEAANVKTGGRHHRHRHHRAHALWTTDGWAQGLQPQEQRQEELSADASLRLAHEASQSVPS